MKALQIIESAYRCTIEEQDDPAVWITHAMKGAGAELDVLLRGNAVNYALTGQDASGLSFGARQQTNPPQLDQDIAKLIEKGVEVYVAEEDMDSRGLSSVETIPGIRKMNKQGLPALFDRYDQVWHW